MRIRLDPKFVEIGPDKKLVILSEEEYESILDLLDAVEAKRALADESDPSLKWEEVHSEVVSNRIAEARRARGLTPKQLARRMKIDVSELRTLERKKSLPRPRQLAKIAAALECEVEDLIG